MAQVLGQAFMKRPFDDPFSAIDAALKPATLGGTAQAVIVEIHAEATSEKMALGHWCDGRASLVVGTHTHVPTADTRSSRAGTAYQSDAGMCGDYDSVIGMDKLEPITRFVTGMAEGPLRAGRGRGDALRRLRRDRRRNRPGAAGGAGAPRRAAWRRPARPEAPARHLRTLRGTGLPSWWRAGPPDRQGRKNERPFASRAFRHPDAPAYFTLAVLAVMFAVFVVEVYPVEVTAMLGAATLVVAGIVPSDGVLEVFSNPAPWTIAAMFIVSGGLVRTGLSTASPGSSRAAPRRTRCWC